MNSSITNTPPPSKLIVDTNVLLHAAFIPEGSAAQCINILKRKNCSLVIDKEIFDEAEKILKRKKEICPDINLLSVLEDFIALNSITVAPKSDEFNLININKNDKHVGNAAMQHNAYILSGDLPLHDECALDNIKTTSPLSVILNFNYESGEVIRNIFRSSGDLTEEEGYIFVGFEISGLGNFTVFELPNLARLYYEHSSKKIIFHLFDGSKVEQEIELPILTHVILCAEYRLNSKIPNISILSAVGKSTSHTKLKRLNNANRSGLKIHPINGWIKDVVMSDRISYDTFKKIVANGGGSPDPYDGGRLDSALTEYQKRYTITKNNGYYTQYNLYLIECLCVEYKYILD